MLDDAGSALRDELLALFAKGVDAPLGDDAFDRLARRVFTYQLRRNPAYAAYARRRGATPESVGHWTGIPAVPTAAFKEIRLVSGDAARAEAVFRTSGTTQGAEKRGEHVVLDLALYHASLLPTFAAYLLPDDARPRMLSLVPPPGQAPDSSLSHMVGVVVGQFGAGGSDWFMDAERGLDEAGLEAALRQAEGDGAPVCLLGTSFAFVHWTDSMQGRGARFRLPTGSRLMDTGGFKGRSRMVEAAELRAAYREILGVPEDHAVNEYGMTELLSQFYDVALREGEAGAGEGPRRKAGPPWLRSVAVDPETLAPLPDGVVGLLRHVDLANLGSVVAVQTEDLGRVDRGGLVLLGRAPGAAPRGCSIAMDLLLEAARREGR